MQRREASGRRMLPTLPDDLIETIFADVFRRHRVGATTTFFALSKTWARWVVSQLSVGTNGERLNRRQMDAIVRAVVLRQNVFLTGPGGVGKSHVARLIIKHLRVLHPDTTWQARDAAPEWQPRIHPRVMVCAFTATAAENCNGRTLHSRFCISTSLQPVSAPRIVYEFSKKEKLEIWGAEALAEEEEARSRARGAGRGEDGEQWASIDRITLNEALVAQLKVLRVLVIDEVSMCGKGMLELLDQCLRQARGDERPFGGVQLIAIGDFLQIPAINDDFCFQSPVWATARLAAVELTECLRVDPTERRFYEVCQRMRFGRLRREDVLYLLQASRQSGHAECALFKDNRLAHAANVRYLATNPNPPRHYRAVDTIWEGSARIQHPPRGLTAPKSADLVATFKVGATVVCSKNVNRQGRCVLANGKVGRVVNLYDDHIRIELLNDHHAPTGRFVEVERQAHVNEARIDDINYGFQRSQFPLKVGFGRTMHKVQGATLCHLVDMDLHTKYGSEVKYGMFYVGWSRVKRPSQVRILNPADFLATAQQCCRADPKAVAFYEAMAGLPPCQYVTHVSETVM